MEAPVHYEFKKVKCARWYDGIKRLITPPPPILFLRAAPLSGYNTEVQSSVIVKEGWTNQILQWELLLYLFHFGIIAKHH